MGNLVTMTSNRRKPHLPPCESLWDTSWCYCSISPPPLVNHIPFNSVFMPFLRHTFIGGDVVVGCLFAIVKQCASSQIVTLEVTRSLPFSSSVFFFREGDFIFSVCADMPALKIVCGWQVDVSPPRMFAERRRACSHARAPLRQRPTPTRTDGGERGNIPPRSGSEQSILRSRKYSSKYDCREHKRKRRSTSVCQV